jgi:hypothetical protein
VQTNPTLGNNKKETSAGKGIFAGLVCQRYSNGTPTQNLEQKFNKNKTNSLFIDQQQKCLVTKKE